MRVVYLDVLLFQNFAVDLLLLYGAAVLGKLDYRKGRLCIGAAVGAALGAILFFMELSPVWAVLFKLTGSVLVLLCAYRLKGPAQLGAALACYLGLSFLYAGTLFALWLLTGDGRQFRLQNGVFYLDVPLWLFLLSGALAWLLLRLIGRHRKKRSLLLAGLLRLTVWFQGRQVDLTAFVDTGNTLCTPVTRIPVAVAELERIGPLLPPEILEPLQKNELLELQSRLSGMEAFRFCLIRYGAVGGGGTLFAFAPDRVVLHLAQGDRLAGSLYFAVMPGKLTSDDSYDCLFHPGVTVRQPIDIERDKAL